MRTILLVEDNDLNRDMLSRRLTRRGYDVSVALDGREAVERARALAPDLILMDMSLPVLDGWAATREIRADDRTSHIPVIALTAHAMADDRQQALEAGCDDFDTKPVEFARLLLKIEALLEREASGVVPPAAPGAAPPAAQEGSAPAAPEAVPPAAPAVPPAAPEAVPPAAPEEKNPEGDAG